MKSGERIFLYGFDDENKLSALTAALKKLKIPHQKIERGDAEQKIGFILGRKGFKRSAADSGFVFPHEVMLLENIRGKRLDEVLDFLKAEGVEKIRFKAAVTPINTLWSFRRLCETMMKEHGALNK